jgi:hypothetical protein
MEKRIHLLRVGWRNFFPSCADVSVFGSGGKGLTICPTSEIVCLPVLIFTYSHVENALFFALELFFATGTTFSKIPIGIL